MFLHELSWSVFVFPFFGFEIQRRMCGRGGIFIICTSVIIALGSAMDIQDFNLRCDLLSTPPTSPAMYHTSASSSRQRFGSVTTQEMEERIQLSQSANTKKKMQWVVRIINQWLHLKPSPSDASSCSDLSSITRDELAAYLPKFIFEVKKQTGEEYPPKTLYEIYAMLNYYFINEAKWTVSLFNDPDFAPARRALDTRMKESAKQGLISGNNKSLAISKTTEENLWSSGILGSDSPSTLLNTVIYLIGTHFAIRGGDELRRLRIGEHGQFKFDVDTSGIQCVIYTEDISKTRQGGLKSIGKPARRVFAYHNDSDHHRCLPCLLKKYLEQRPISASSDALFLSPLKFGQNGKWYKDVPFGRNSLANVIKTITAGVEGRYTNHSMRRTSATRLFQEGVSDDLIKLHTGHRSNAILEYKQPSDDQHKRVSDLLYSVVCTQETAPDTRAVRENAIPENAQPPCKKMIFEMETCKEYESDKERTVVELEKNNAKLRIFM